MTDASNPNGVFDDSTPTMQRVPGPRAGEQTSDPQERLAERFRLLSLLGRGTEASVYGALDLLLHRRVALKRYPEPSDQDGARILGSARLMAQLSHPNIVATYDVLRLPRELVVVHEFLDGGDLERAPPTTLDEALLCLLAIARAVRYSHSKGIAHGDLKPSNVLRAGSGVVKLLDFGMARSLAITLDETQPLGGNGGGGTPLYLAPERFGAGAATSAGDAWSFGVLIHKLLTGRVPFKGPTLLSLLQAVCHSVPPPLTTKSSDDASGKTTMALQGVVDGCLAKTPTDRYAFERIASSLGQIIVSRDLGLPLVVQGH